MSDDRIHALEAFLNASPEDCFVRYGLAQELLKQGRNDEAIKQFERILEINADYQAAYYHGGKTYQKLARADDARELYRRGIETAQRCGDLHARSELEAALVELG